MRASMHWMVPGCVPLLTAAVLLGAPDRASAADAMVKNENVASTAAMALVPRCSASAFGDPDGVPKGAIDPDGVPKGAIDPDGKGVPLMPLGNSLLTTAAQPDLGIAYVAAKASGDNYTLRFCVFNRGGKTATPPIAIALRAGDVSLQEYTIYRAIPSLRALCVGNASRHPVPAGVKLAGATMQVSTAPGEIATVDNQCRIDWGQ